ncbi:MAG: leucine-rich repeat protein, partial [Clostridia bacterium]|nr:leucine-rich repeat protein [Clostridia bacterium]
GNNDSEEGSGSAIGGSTIGGSTIGGSTIGGSTIGGNNGGSTIGGSTIGGSTIGGSTIGGNDSEDEGSDTETETSVTLKYLGNNAFKGCTSLTSIDLPGIPENAGTRVFEGWTAEQTINLSNTEEELTEQTENGLFEGCSATINYKAA